MKIKIKALKKIILESLSDFSTELEVGDLVDVMLDHAYGTYYKIRVLKLVPNVAKVSGLSDDDNVISREVPGFLGRNEDPNNYDMDVGEEGWFTMEEIVPNSKAKYYFPDTDDPDRPGIYRKIARRNAMSGISRSGDYVEEL